MEQVLRRQRQQVGDGGSHISLHWNNSGEGVGKRCGENIFGLSGVEDERNM